MPQQIMGLPSCAMPIASCMMGVAGKGGRAYIVWPVTEQVLDTRLMDDEPQMPRNYEWQKGAVC